MKKGTNSIFLLTTFVLFMSGCATFPPLSFSVPNVGLSQIKIDAELKSMTCTTGRPDEVTGEISHSDGPGICDLWKTALQEALDKMLIFKDDAKKKITIAIKILKFEIPSGGISMTTKTDAKYEITGRSNGDILYSSIINAEGTVPFSYAFSGVERIRESVNRSAQNNILQFLQALEIIDFSKPIFPGKKP